MSSSGVVGRSKSPFHTRVSANTVCRPPDLSATVSLAIHASFEFQPVSGDGEQLRKLTINSDELLDRNGKDLYE